MTATVEPGVVLEDFQEYVEEHGIGLSKKEFFLTETEETNLELMRAVKQGFDPKQILNSHISYNL